MSAAAGALCVRLSAAADAQLWHTLSCGRLSAEEQRLHSTGWRCGAQPHWAASYLPRNGARRDVNMHLYRTSPVACCRRVYCASEGCCSMSALRRTVAAACWHSRRCSHGDAAIALTHQALRDLARPYMTGEARSPVLASLGHLLTVFDVTPCAPGVTHPHAFETCHLLAHHCGIACETTHGERAAAVCLRIWHAPAHASGMHLHSPCSTTLDMTACTHPLTSTGFADFRCPQCRGDAERAQIRDQPTVRRSGAHCERASPWVEPCCGWLP